MWPIKQHPSESVEVRCEEAPNSYSFNADGTESRAEIMAKTATGRMLRKHRVFLRFCFSFRELSLLVFRLCSKFLFDIFAPPQGTLDNVHHPMKICHREVVFLTAVIYHKIALISGTEKYSIPYFVFIG